MKVEYKSEKRLSFDKSYIWYRKDLSDIPWWKKLFIRNPWRLVYCFNDCLKFLFNASEANEIADKYTTVEELEKFLSEEKSKAEKMLEEHLKEPVEGWRF